jgi:hypothetical protein
MMCFVLPTNTCYVGVRLQGKEAGTGAGVCLCDPCLLQLLHNSSLQAAQQTPSLHEAASFTL